MSELPKLRIKKSYDHVVDEIYDIEQSKAFFNPIPPTLVIVDGHVVASHDELLQLVARDIYKNKELLEVELLPIQGGG